MDHETEQLAESSGFPIGPLPDVKYPIKVTYCGNCTMPLEYCEFYPEYERCKEWLQHNMPDEFVRLNLGKLESDNDEEFVFRFRCIICSRAMWPNIVNLKCDSGQESNTEADEKKRQKRGGKGGLKAKKKQEVVKSVKLALASRGKKNR